jgi:hypothetical protein
MIRIPPEPEKEKIDTVIFHGRSCPDGFASALVVFAYFAERGLEQPKYFPVRYLKGVPEHGSPPKKGREYKPPVPFGFPSDIRGKHIIVLDFSLNKVVMGYVFDRCASYLQLDHHETAIVDIPNCHYEKGECGAIMTWKYFYPDRPVPALLKDIRARDLWVFNEVEGSREFSIARHIEMVREAILEYLTFSCQPFDFDDWLPCLDDTYYQTKRKELVQNGEKYIKYQNFVQDILSRSAPQKTVFGFRARVINSPNWPSEMGEKLLQRYPDCQLAVIWGFSDQESCYNIHLRSSSAKVSDFLFDSIRKHDRIPPSIAGIWRHYTEEEGINMPVPLDGRAIAI